MIKPPYRYTREFKVTNFTRYNTDDIGALIEEAYARSAGFSTRYTYVSDSGGDSWKMLPNCPTEYVVKDYTGVEAAMVKKPDRMVDNIQTLRFRPHTKLKVGNLEQLAIASSGEVPGYLVKQALAEMGGLFRRFMDERASTAIARTPQLRIMPRRGRVVTKQERQRVFLEKIVKHVQTAEYRYDGMVVLNGKTHNSVVTLTKMRKKGKLPATKEEAELLRLVNLSLDVSRQLAACLKSFPDVLQKAITATNTPSTEK